MTRRSIQSRTLWRIRCISSLLLSVFILSPASAEYDRAWCDKVPEDKTTDALVNDNPFFHKSFRALSENTVTGSHIEELVGFSQSTMQFSHHNSQVSVQMKSSDGRFSAYVDTNTNVCLIQQWRNGQCVKSKDPCVTISELTGTVTPEGDRVSLKSPSQSLGWDPDLFDKIANVGPSQTRGINSVLYVTCAKDNTSANTVVSQWHFLNISTMSAKENQYVLLMSKERTEGDNNRHIRTTQIDYAGVEDINKERIRSPMDLNGNGCVSENKESDFKKIPTPPTTFSCIKETYMGQIGNPDCDIEIESLLYNHGSDWFYYNNFLTSLGKMEKTETTVIEDYKMGVRYEISKTSGTCRTYPTLTRAAHQLSRGRVRMKTPTDFWNISPDTAVYLGVTTVRSIPCDVWRVGLSETNNETAYTLFVATSDWIRKRRLTKESFFPVQVIEEKGSNFKYHSYFAFKSQPKYSVPDVSSCYNSTNSETVRLTLLTSFYKNIKNRLLQFELKLRSVVLRLTGIVSTLRVTGIWARAAPEEPFQTRVIFTILGSDGFSSNSSETQVSDLVSASEAVESLRKAINEGKLEFTLVAKSAEILVKTKAGSLEEHSALEGQLDDNERGTSLDHPIGRVIGLCILTLMAGMGAGWAAVYGYKRWSDKEFESIVESGERPQSISTVSGFGMLRFGDDDEIEAVGTTLPPSPSNSKY